MGRLSEVLAAVDIQRRYPKYLRLKWRDIIEGILSEGRFTSNEMARMLDLDYRQFRLLVISLSQMRHMGLIRKHGKQFELVNTREYFTQTDIKRFFYPSP